MSIRILRGDCRAMLPTLPDASVQCCVTSPQKNNGRFRQGERRSVGTEFKPGQHWLHRKPHWDRDWMLHEYVTLGRSAGDIAVGIGTTEANVYHWLRKHDIPRRSISEARALKHWGVFGEANPMFGKTGSKNPRYVDGSSPERQRLYAQGSGRSFVRAILARDGFNCQRCGSGHTGPKGLHVHHIKPWAGNAALRFDMGNAVTLCRYCHRWVHSNANAAKEFLA